MRKYKHKSIPAPQKARVYEEGKGAFLEGKHRSENPYAANNLRLSVIWWNGWDTGEEESEAVRSGKRKPSRPTHISD